MTRSHQFCTFYLENLLFGVELQGVQEVIRRLDVTPVPLATEVVRGLVNLRGQIITAVDLRRQLGFPTRPPDAVHMNVVVRNEDGAVSLIVDRVGDVIKVEDSTFERPPEMLLGNVRSMILGVHKLNNRLLHVLDIPKACQMKEEWAGPGNAVVVNR